MLLVPGRDGAVLPEAVDNSLDAVPLAVRRAVEWPVLAVAGALVTPPRDARPRKARDYFTSELGMKAAIGWP